MTAQPSRAAVTPFSDNLHFPLSLFEQTKSVAQRSKLLRHLHNRLLSF
jgi:hypothetical protein